MTQNVDGTQKLTVVTAGTTSGLFANDGSWNAVLNASPTGAPYGIQHSSGAYNVSVGDTSNYYTPNGNINVYNGTYGYTPTTTPIGTAVKGPKPAVALPLSSRLATEGSSIDAGSNGPTHLFFAQMASGGRFYEPGNLQFAVSGRNVDNALASVATLKSFSPDIVYIGFLQTNSIGNLAQSAATVWTKTKQLIISYLSGGATWVVLVPIFPRVVGTFPWSAQNETDRLAYNVLLAGFATDPDLALWKNNILLVPNFDGTFDPTAGVNTIEGLHPNWAGAKIIGNAVGAVLATAISSSDVLANYTNSSNVLISDGFNPQFAGVDDGTLGVGASGAISHNWGLNTGSVADLQVVGQTFLSNGITLNGAQAQRLIVSGTNATSHQICSLSTKFGLSSNLLVGFYYDLQMDLSIATGSQNLESIYINYGGSSFSFNAAPVAGQVSVPLSAGVIRSVSQLVAAQQNTQKFSVNLKFAVGTCAADITVGRPIILKRSA